MPGSVTFSQVADNKMIVACIRLAKDGGRGVVRNPQVNSEVSPNVQLQLSLD